MNLNVYKYVNMFMNSCANLEEGEVKNKLDPSWRWEAGVKKYLDPPIWEGQICSCISLSYKLTPSHLQN